MDRREDETRRTGGVVTGTGNPTAGTAATAGHGTPGTTHAASSSDQGGKVQQAASAVKDQAQEKVGQVAEQAKQQATSRVESQKERAVDSLGSVAQAIRQTGQELRQQDQVAIGQYADKAAEQVERLASYLRRHDVGELIEETERFARRRPGLFLGGGFALGLVAARFLKSSGERQQAKERYYQSLRAPTYDRAPGFQYSEMDRPASDRPEVGSEYASGSFRSAPSTPGDDVSGALGTTPSMTGTTPSMAGTTPSATPTTPELEPTSSDLESRSRRGSSPGLEE